MTSGLLSLKWNNHKSTFFHVLSTIRSKESYCDVTLACDGRFYSLHKFVLSTCSEYFEQMFERTQCKHPVIVLKDIKHDDLEALLNYMYVGEVNVVQEKLAGLIKAAECLKIKGLAVPDEDPVESAHANSVGREQLKRTQRTDDSPHAKRRRRDNNSSEIEVISPPKSHSSSKISEEKKSRQANNMLVESEADITQQDSSREENEEFESQEASTNSSVNGNRKTESTNSHKKKSLQPSSQKKEPVPEEVTVDEADVKAEPLDAENEEMTEEDLEDNKDSLHHELGFDPSDSMGGNDDNYVDVDPSMLSDQPQSVEDVVAQAIPGASGFQENSFPVWEGEGSLSNFPVEGFSADNSQAHQMDWLQQQEQLLQQQLNHPYYPQNVGVASPNMLESKPLPSAPSHSVFPEMPLSGIPPCSSLGGTSASELIVPEQTSATTSSFLHSRPQRSAAATQISSQSALAVQSSSSPSDTSKTDSTVKKTTYKCKFCSNTYRLESYVRKHVRNKHQDKLATSTATGPSSSGLTSSGLYGTVATFFATTSTAGSIPCLPSNTTVLTESAKKAELAGNKEALPTSSGRPTRIRPIRPKRP